MIVDLVNGLCIVVAAGFTWRSVWTLWRDGEVRGTSIGLFAFFAVWGIWQLWFYVQLKQWWSVAGTLPLCLGNWVWVVLVVYFRRYRKT